jgi:cytochrome c oxidase cbb3-type subunit III
VIRDPELVRFAQKQAKPLYAANCAACHGAQMTGNPALGAPNLTDKVWLYGNGGVFDIERTLLYGIRSKQNKSRNVAEMPAFGLTGVLRDVEIRNVVQYVLQLSGRPHQGPAASEGEAVYHNTDKGRCADCHGYDARGNSDYGAPDLTVNVWNSGSDAQALYNAIYYGQHRMMPAWIGKLTLEQIRALAIYIYSASHPADISRAAVNHE